MTLFYVTNSFVVVEIRKIIQFDDQPTRYSIETTGYIKPKVKPTQRYVSKEEFYTIPTGLTMEDVSHW